MRRIVIGVIIAVVVIGGGWFAYQQFFAPAETDDQAVDVNDIAIDTGIDSVAAEGEVVPLDYAFLAFQVGGQVAEVLVEEGQTVQKGDLLIRLDAADQELALTQAQAGLTQAQANLQTAEAQRQQAQVGVETARVGVDAAEAALALTTADPSAERIALQESQIEQTDALINQAAGSRDVTLEGPTEAEIAAAEAELRAAEAAFLAPRDRLDALRRNDGDTDDIEQAQLEYNAAFARIEAAQARLEELRAGARPPQRQAASAGVAAAAAQRDAAQANLDLLLAGPKPEAVTVDQVSVEQAEQAVVDAELALKQAEAAVAQAEAGVIEAEAAVAAAENVLRKMTLVAPFDGTVAAIDTKVGQVVSPSTPVVTLANFSKWFVETTDLTELDVVSIARGFPVSVEIDALPNVLLSGTVVDIAQSSELVFGDVTYEVRIELDEDASEIPLRWGMTAFVTVETEQ